MVPLLHAPGFHPNLCPHREQEPSSSHVLYTETCRTVGSHIGGCQTFRYWDSLEKCPLWLLLPAAQIHLQQLLIAYSFIDLVALYHQNNVFTGYWQATPSLETSSLWYVMAFGADLPQVVGWAACEAMHLFGAGPLTHKGPLISMALVFQ